ncbi:MAG TPA: elongation factor G [Acidimicrobiales bacterium]|nr:elongation factor G [Acidimicrobiales bacterium]
MDASRGHPKARTVAVIGRNGAGKTSLLEAMVVATKGLERPGKVEDGTALGAREPEERKHQMSLGIAMAPVWVGDDKLTLLDTPGFIDFYGDVERALDVADVALLVVNAVDGVQSDTVVLWRLCRDAGIPVVIFINALDAERADFETTLGSLEKLIGPSLAPLELPIGIGAEFTGVVDLLADEAISYGPAGPRRGAVPGELAELEQRVRDSLLEAIVVGDDSMTERYLEGEVPSMEELESGLSGLMTQGHIVPVTCGSATQAIGIDRLVTLLDEIAESRPITMLEHGDEVLLTRDPDDDPVLRAFKVIVDPYVGRIVVMEVVSGTVKNEATLTNARTRSEERLHGLNYLFGAKLVPMDKAVAGDVVAVAKLTNVQVGDVLERRGRDLAPVPAPAPTPALSVAVIGTGKDDEKISTSLHRLAEEDPSLHVRFDPTSRHLVIDVMGEMHLQVTLERLRRRFNLEVTTAPPPVPYFETIVKGCDVEGRLKKQTGGHGQYAVVNVKVEPLEATSPFEFVDAVVGGSVPRQYIGAVKNGVEKAMAHGGPSGQPVVGLRVTLYDGKHHSVDSSEFAFETAGSMALRNALEKSGTAVLERIMAVEATVPGEYLGDVLTDLSGRRGKVMATNHDESGASIVIAHVPESQLTRYGLELRSLTGGRGRVSITPHHLSEAPKAALK